MSALLDDKKKHKATAADFRSKFVFLNVYCRSVKEEHDPRGPEGPFRFTDRSVPVVVIKKFDGTSLVHQLGWGGGADRLASLVDKAVKKNGPVAPPRVLRPLLKSWDKAEKALTKKNVRDAIRELQKIGKLASDKKKFAEGPPEVATKAKEKLAALEKQALARIDSLLEEGAQGEDAAKGAARKLRRMRGDYRVLAAVDKAIGKALETLEG